MIFYVGLHQPSDAQHFERSFISVNRLRNRKGAFAVNSWIMDSGAFTTIMKYGGYPYGVESYVSSIKRWNKNGDLIAVVAQDYMCEPHMIRKTGLSVADHQRLTIDRYDSLMQHNIEVIVMPVLQGYYPHEYVDHLKQYGNRLVEGAYVGVGSVCKRNGDPEQVRNILLDIKVRRPDLRLHGFGLKMTALRDYTIRKLLYSCDSMAWSFAARYGGRNANDWREAKKFEYEIKMLEQ